METRSSSAASSSPLTPAQQAEFERELGLEGAFLAAADALREIAENTTRTSYQHRARALLALEQLERRWDQ